MIGTVSRNVIERDGLYFKDLDGSGEFKDFDDWRIPARERAEAYVKTLTTKEKIAQLFISDWRMGKYTDRFPDHKPQLDESGVLDDGEFHGKTIFGEQTSAGHYRADQGVVCPSPDPARQPYAGRYDRLDQPASCGCGGM